MTTTATTKSRFRTVAAVVAVTIACSSGAYAAGAMITSSAQIKDGVVTSGDIKNRTITAKDISKKTQSKFAPKLEAWKSPTLVGFWHADDTAYAKPGFRKNAEGLVTLRGALTQGANVVSGSLVTTLPEGYRPSACLAFPVASFDAIDGASDPDGALSICPDGKVQMFGETDDRFATLDGISFYVN